MATRYDAIGPEAEFEPGSRGRVLRNLLGIRSARQMAKCESDALLAATSKLIREVESEQRITAAGICEIHELWLRRIYAWAGHYRQLNVNKDGFMFAASAQVPRLMRDFERGPLREYTPCPNTHVEVQARALAVVHTELILIHPFREGNGRCARLVAVLMALQAGLPVLDFAGVKGTEKQRYIAAVQAGLDRNYGPMSAVFRKIIDRTLRRSGQTNA
jgi:cell filamentation protein